MEQGGWLLLAQLTSDGSADRAIALLENYASKIAAADLPDAVAGTISVGSEEAPAGEERIPLLEEEIRIGKREVERGGARGRSTVTEMPVTEQVELLEEHVMIEGRTAGRTLSERMSSKAACSATA